MARSLSIITPSIAFEAVIDAILAFSESWRSSWGA